MQRTPYRIGAIAVPRPICWPPQDLRLVANEVCRFSGAGLVARSTLRGGLREFAWQSRCSRSLGKVGTMHRLVSLLAITALGVLGSGCSFAMRPVHVDASAADWVALAGDWRGDYAIAGRDRHGVIEFRLKALEHEASGDVLMISRSIRLAGQRNAAKGWLSTTTARLFPTAGDSLRRGRSRHDPGHHGAVLGSGSRMPCLGDLPRLSGRRRRHRVVHLGLRRPYPRAAGAMARRASAWGSLRIA